MTHPANQMARLNAKTQSFESARGGVPEFTQSDIAAGLAGLPRLHQEYGHMKYVELPTTKTVICERVRYVEEGGERYKRTERRYRPEAMTKLRELQDLALDHVMASVPLRYTDGETLKVAVNLALKECIDPEFTRCKSCGGSGKNLHQKDCKPCLGSGRESLTQAEYARRIGVDRSNWQRKWSGLYERIYREISSLDDMIFRHLRKKLSRDC